MILYFVFTLIWLMFGHTIADGIFQAERWAINKSKNIQSLFSHTVMYSIIMTVFAMVCFNIVGGLIFGLITFILHTFTDYFTSKIVSTKFKNKQLGTGIPNFGAFTWILFDQFLHFFQIILTTTFILFN